jgi:hypothetical protein
VAYGAGLRASQVVSLKVDDINSTRMSIRVEQGKGSKDRYALLSPSLLEVLRAWWREGKAGGKMLPLGWLFPGQDPVDPLSTRRLNRACHGAAEAAGITKRVSLQGRGRKSNIYRLELSNNRQSVSACPGQRNRSSASACPDGQPELQFRNAASDCPEATGSLAQGNRKSATGNRNATSAETEEGNGRKEFIDTPPYPPSAGNAPSGEDGCEPRSPGGLDNRSSGVAGEGAVARALPLPAAAESRGQVTGSPAPGPSVNGPSAAVIGSPKVVTLESAAVEEGAGMGSQSKQRKGPLTHQNAGSPSPRWGSGQRTRKTREKGNGTDRQSTAKDYTVGATSDEDLPDWASGWRDRAHVAK